MDWNKLLDEQIKRINTHNRLVSKGVDSRVALEAVYGKEIVDKTYRDIEGLQGKQKTINQQNN